MLPVVEAVLPDVLLLSVDAVDPVDPVELVDVDGMVSVGVDDVEGVGGSAGLLQAPRASAAVTAMIAAAVWVMVRFMKILLNWLCGANSDFKDCSPPPRRNGTVTLVGQAHVLALRLCL
ncbi:MAG: hypothetical protein V4669_19875 [Pseudomonadota bacterium]